MSFTFPDRVGETLSCYYTHFTETRTLKAIQIFISNIPETRVNWTKAMNISTTYSTHMSPVYTYKPLRIYMGVNFRT